MNRIAEVEIALNCCSHSIEEKSAPESEKERKGKSR